MKPRLIILVVSLLLFSFTLSGCDEVQITETQERSETEKETVVEDKEVEEVDVDADVELIKKAFSKKYDSHIEDIEIFVNNATDSHMRGLVKIGPETTGGGMFLAAKIEGTWEIIHDGQGVYNCSDAEFYGFPKEMISDCYEEP